MNKKNRYIFFALLIIGVVFAVWAMLSYRGTDPSYQHTERLHGFFPDHPEINGSPNAFLTIEGEHPFGVETLVKIEYITFSPGCGAYTTEYFDTGRKNVQSVSDIYTIPSGTTNINLQIPLDRYQPGKCDWQPVRLWGSTAEPTTKKDQRVWSLITSFSQSGATVAEQTAWCRPNRDAAIQVEGHYCSWHFPGNLASSGGHLTLKFVQLS